MAGYGVDVPRRATGTHTKLFARCTILWADDVPHVIVTCDVLGFGRDLHQEIRRSVAALGVSSENFVLTATHTHCGPVLPEKLDPYATYNLTDDDEVTVYRHLLARAVYAVVDEALFAPKTEVTLDYRTAIVGFAFNREKLDHDETEVPVLVARRHDGTPRVILFGYGAHPVAGGRQHEWDADYPGVACTLLEAAFDDVHAQFLTGPAGDQNPHDPRGFDAAHQYGTDLAGTVADAVTIPGTPVTGSPRTVYDEVALPLDLTGLDHAAAAFTVRSVNPDVAGYKHRHARQMLVALADGSFDFEVLLPVQVWAFDGLTVVFCGGEVVSGFAVTARALTGGPLWFAGYANEVPCYIPTDDLIDHPCYAGGRDADSAHVGGGSMTIYNLIAPFPSSPDGVQDRLNTHVRRLVIEAAS